MSIGKNKSDENAYAKGKQDVEVLLLQIEALQSQMADQARVSKDQVSEKFILGPLGESPCSSW